MASDPAASLPILPQPTDSERRAMVELAAGARTPTEVGERLYGGRFNRQAYARPGGKLLRALERKGLARPESERIGDKTFIRWRLTTLGLRVGRTLGMG